MPSSQRTLESALAAIEAAGWRWNLSRTEAQDPRLVALGAAETVVQYRLRLECGNHREGRHVTLEGPRLTTVLAEAIVYTDRAREVPPDAG
jgi:hypothetical protein